MTINVTVRRERKLAMMFQSADKESAPVRNSFTANPHFMRAILLASFLTIMLRFPIRSTVLEPMFTMIFYGIMILLCLFYIVYINKQLDNKLHGVIAILTLCILMSIWQIVDMTLLRGGPSSLTLPYDVSENRAYYDEDLFLEIGHRMTWYDVRFPNSDIGCHNITEKYFGNELIAIVYDIDRRAKWWGCE